MASTGEHINTAKGRPDRAWQLNRENNAALARAMQAGFARIRETWGKELTLAQPEWYGALPKDELDMMVGKSLSVFRQCLMACDMADLQDYLDETSVDKLKRGISINDMMEGMLLGKEAVWQVISGSAGPARALDNLRAPLEDFFRNAMTLVAKNYATLIQERLTRQSDKLAVQAERQRLARELHDSVTQSLYSIGLYADAARRALKSGKDETTLNHLMELKTMSTEAMVDMRALVFELHSPELESQGLEGALQARLNAVEIRAGMKADLSVKGTPLPISLPQSEDLFRIAMEALNNVLKHAESSQVQVTLEYGASSLALSVADQGVGFDPGQTGHGGYGLKGMRERARRLGTELKVESALGQGCRISLVLEFNLENPQGE